MLLKKSSKSFILVELLILLSLTALLVPTFVKNTISLSGLYKNHVLKEIQNNQKEELLFYLRNKIHIQVKDILTHLSENQTMPYLQKELYIIDDTSFFLDVTLKKIEEKTKGMLIKADISIFQNDSSLLKKHSEILCLKK